MPRRYHSVVEYLHHESYDEAVNRQSEVHRCIGEKVSRARPRLANKRSDVDNRRRSGIFCRKCLRFQQMFFIFAPMKNTNNMTYKDVFKIRHRRCSYEKKALLDYLLSITTCDNIVDNGNGFDIPLHVLRDKSDCFLNHMTTFLRYVSTVDYIDRENNCIHFYLSYGYDKNSKTSRIAKRARKSSV